jgi:hypothetical protein
MSLALSTGYRKPERNVGTKPSNNYQSDRPESGGADKDGIRENNGLLEKEREKFAQEKAAEKNGNRESGIGNRESGIGNR